MIVQDGARVNGARVTSSVVDQGRVEENLHPKRLARIAGVLYLLIIGVRASKPVEHLPTPAEHIPEPAQRMPATA